MLTNVSGSCVPSISQTVLEKTKRSYRIAIAEEPGKE